MKSKSSKKDDKKSKTTDNKPKRNNSHNPTGRNFPKGCPDPIPAKHAGGRPTKLTEDLIKEYEKLQKSSFYNDTIICMLDLSRDNVQQWRRRGRREFERLMKDDQVLPDPKEYLFLKFFLIVRKSTARKEVNCIKGILRAGRDAKYWTALAWILERTLPEKYGNKSQEIREMKKMLEDLHRQLMKKETEEMIDKALVKKTSQDEEKANE